MESSAARPLPGTPVCKVTYLGRKKRNQAEFVSDTDTSALDIPPMAATANSASPSAESITIKGPKKVEVSLPGPSPKRARHGTNGLTKAKEPWKSKKATHVRSVSSISSADRVADPGGDASSTAKKPLSVSKPPSEAKSATAEDDDNASVADSSISLKIRRNEAERLEYFRNQPECGKIEPHRVQCLLCGKSVNLGRRQTYAVRPWEIHRVRCDQKQAQTMEASLTNVVVQGAVLDTPSVAPSHVSRSYVVRRQTEAERKAYLESDKQAEIVEEGRVRCRKCQIWVILSDKQVFSTGQWVKHKSKCSDILPSNRVAAAKRKLLVVNDPQAKSFDARRIECTLCGLNVALQGDGDFNLTIWDEHKAQCTRSGLIAGSECLNSITFPRQLSQSPLSLASTEDTVIAPESIASDAPQSFKRRRDETDVEDTQKPAVRPRTGSYVPADKEAPGPFGWFLLPFRSFARGFRESLKNGS